MMDIRDKNTRAGLIRKYMDAETDNAEEKLLADYWAYTEPDSDELEVARLLLSERKAFAATDGSFIEQFDRITAGYSSRRRRVIARIAAIAGSISVAAAVAMFVLFGPLHKDSAVEEPAFDTIEIARSIQEIMELGFSDVESITAKPMGSNILLEVSLTDGGTRTYIMTKHSFDGSSTLMAVNE